VPGIEVSESMLTVERRTAWFRNTDRYESGWQEYHRQEGDRLHNLIVHAGQHIESLHQLVSPPQHTPGLLLLGQVTYQGYFSPETFVSCLRPGPQALHHLQLERQVFLCLVLVILGEAIGARGNGLEVTFLLGKQALHRLDGDCLNFRYMICMPEQIV
jgi:hypothetical protein